MKEALLCGAGRGSAPALGCKEQFSPDNTVLVLYPEVFLLRSMGLADLITTTALGGRNHHARFIER